MTKYRREDGNNAGNAIKQRQYLGAAALVQRIAQNGKGDDVAASRADPRIKRPIRKCVLLCACEHSNEASMKVMAPKIATGLRPDLSAARPAKASR